MIINKISLRDALPHVFRGAENDSPVCHSAVWKRNIDFERGRYYLVEAESGTGKSSLLSFIYGNRRDYDGTILFNGTPTRTFTPGEWCRVRRQSLALLPQEMRLFGELTALENINIKNRLTGFHSHDEIMEMLSRVELDHKANVKASRLSIGQQQRVAIVRTLCQPFTFLFLDEPVSHLDSRNNLVVAQMIVENARAQGAAIVTTSVGNPLLLEQVEQAGNITTVKL